MKQRRIVLPMLICVCVLALLALFVWPRPPVLPPLPNPNGYENFVKAGQMLTVSLGRHRDLGDYREMSVEELRRLALTNVEALRTARNGFDHQCWIPIRSGDDWFRTHMDEFSSLKRLAFAFCVAGRLAQLEGQTNEAAKLYTDLIRFAHESTRGGMIVDALVGIAIEALGVASLQDVQLSLDATQSRQIAKALETVDARREPWHEILNEEAAYSRRAYGWTAGFVSFFSLASRGMRKSFNARFHAADKRRRQFIIALAARAYELEKGQRPKTLTDLVPDYLKAIPQDPFSGTNMVFTP